jgi:hypothetical protein
MSLPSLSTQRPHLEQHRQPKDQISRLQLEAAAEMILRLRSLRTQVLELQSRLRQLETKQSTQAASQQLRLTQYREVYFEATWIELEFQE